MFKLYLHKNYRWFSSVKFWLHRRVTRRGWLVGAFLFATGALGMDTNLSLAYQTFSFLLCLVLVALLGRFFHRTSFTGERTLPRFGSVGEKLSYQVTLHNRTNRPQRALTLFDELSDPRPSFRDFADTPEPGEIKRNWYDRTWAFYRWQWLIQKNTLAVIPEQPLPTLPPEGSVEITVTLVPLRRGVIRWEGMTLAGLDPFGLFRSFRKISLPQSLLVLPRRYPLRALDLPGVMQYQQGGVTLASAVGESEEFVALRDYRAGDPLRHIHWRSFAKLGRPIVKEFQDEFFVRHALILDTFHPHAYSEVFEEAVSVAASFACALQTQDSLLDLLFVGAKAYCFTSGRGVAHVEQMLEIMAGVQTCRDQAFTTLEQAVLEHANAVSGGICIFLAWDQARQDFVRKLKLLGLPLLVMVVTETEDKLDPGPLAETPQQFLQLPVGRVAERLAAL